MGYPISKLGSLERYIHAQACELGKEGHDVQIVYDGGKGSAASSMARQIHPDIKIHYDFPSPSPKFSSALAYLRYFFKAYTFIKEGKFDIVHTYFEPSTQIINILAPMFPETIFVRTMGVVPRHPNTSTLIGRLKQIYHYVNLFNYDKVVCVSESVRDSLLMYKLNLESLAIVYNAVDTGLFRRYHSRPSDPSPFYLTFCGRLEQIKNIECLIKGMDLLVDECKTRNIVLNIYGAGSCADSLKELVIQEGLERYVHFKGLTLDTVKVLNEETDVYVQASFSEGLPASVLEAMSCELPVVVSEIGGHRTVVKDRINGMLFDPLKPETFAEKIRELLGSYELRKELATNARKTIEGSFDISASIRREKNVYESLLKSG